MTDEDPPNIIPFGKHKGKTIQEVQTFDPGYLDWLEGQPWFRDKFVILHQTIINRGAEPEETPDHNALQVLFLNDAFCLKVADLGGFNPRAEFERHRKMVVERPTWYGMTDKDAQQLIYEPKIRERQFEQYGIDVVFKVVTRLFEDGCVVEIKPTVGDDYPAILRQINALVRLGHTFGGYRKILFLQHYVGVGATEDQFKAMFQASRVGVVFRHEVE